MVTEFGAYLVLLYLLLGTIPPLNDTQLEVLRNFTVDDTGLMKDEPLDILIENVKKWDQPVEVEVEDLDFDFINNQPGIFRGELVRISGNLLRIDDTPAGYSDMEAWIIQIRQTEHIVVVLLPVVTGKASEISENSSSVNIIARFYKRLRLPKSGTSEFSDYLGLVGAYPHVVYEENVDSKVLMVMVSIILTGMIFWFYLLRVSKSKYKFTQILPGIKYYKNDSGYDNLDDGNLPVDQVSALSELRNRADKLCE